MSFTPPTFEDIEVLSASDVGGTIPFELVGDEVQRLSVVRNLPNYLRSPEASLCMTRVVPKVMLSLDKASPEYHMTAAPIFCSILEKKLIQPKTYAQTFLLSILSCINHKDPGISALWLDVLLAVMDLLPVDIIRTDILPIAIGKAQIPSTVLARLLAAKILGKAGSRLDVSQLKKEVLPTLMGLCQDVNYEVRASTCMQLKFIGKALDQEIIKTALFPLLVDLSNDEEVMVRAAAMDTAVELIPYLHADSIKSTILPLVKKLCTQSMSNEDDVLCTISFQFGKMCINLEQYTTVTEKQWMVTYYQELAHLGLKSPGAKSHKFVVPDLSADIMADRFILCRQNCAYNLPAMILFVLKLGDAFKEKLFTTFCNLCSDTFFMVRRTVCCGLHETTAALGPSCSIVKKELVKFLRDDSDDVIHGLIPVLGKTLEQFAKNGQMGLNQMDAQSIEIGRAILKCEMGLSERHDWRLHADMLKQLETLPRVFSSDFIYTYFVPSLFTRVRRVRPIPCRDAATRVLILLLKYNRSQPQRNDMRNRMITEFCRGRSCYHRMQFIKLCRIAMEVFSRRYFKDYFFLQVLELVYDKVINVRLMVVSILPNLKRMLFTPTDKQLIMALENALRKLVANEKDRDVLLKLNTVMQQMGKIVVRDETKPGPQTKEDLEDHRRMEEEKRLIVSDGAGRVGVTAPRTAPAGASRAIPRTSLIGRSAPPFGRTPAPVAVGVGGRGTVGSVGSVGSVGAAGAAGTAGRGTVGAVGSVGGVGSVGAAGRGTVGAAGAAGRGTVGVVGAAGQGIPGRGAQMGSVSSLEDEFYVDAGIRIPQQLAASGELPTFSSRIPNLREILFKNRNAKLVAESQSHILSVAPNSKILSGSSLELQREINPPSLLPLPASLSYSPPSSSTTTTTFTSSPFSTSTVDSIAITPPSTANVATSPSMPSSATSSTGAGISFSPASTSVASQTSPRAVSVKIPSSASASEFLKAESKIPPKRVSSNGITVQVKSGNIIHRTHTIDIGGGSHKTETTRLSNSKGRTILPEQKQKDGSVANRRHSYMDGDRTTKGTCVSVKSDDTSSRKSGQGSGNRRHSYIERMPGEEAGKSSKSLYTVRRSFTANTNAVRQSYMLGDVASPRTKTKSEVTLRRSMIPSRCESGIAQAEVQNKRRSLTYAPHCESAERTVSHPPHPHSLSLENKRSRSSLERDDLERLKSPSFGQIRESTANHIRSLRSSLEKINALKSSAELRLDMNAEKHSADTSGQTSITPVDENLDVVLRKRNRLSLSKIPRGPASCHSSPGGSRASSPTGPPSNGIIIRTHQRTAPNSRSTSPTNSSGVNFRRSQRLSLGSLNSYMSNMKLSDPSSRLPVRKPN